jgi:hypothetical protein
VSNNCAFDGLSTLSWRVSASMLARALHHRERRGALDPASGSV